MIKLNINPRQSVKQNNALFFISRIHGDNIKKYKKIN